MARYAFASGLLVPPSVVQTIEAFATRSPDGGEAAPQNADIASEGARQNMLSDAPGDSKRLVLAHRRLSQIVVPATPRTLVFLETETKSKSVLRFLGPVPLVRHMMLVAIICLLLFIGLSLSGYVSLEHQDESIFDCSGLPLLANEGFLLAAAGLGASFAILFEVNRYLVRGTFDPRYSASYWIRFALGLIAGIVLVELLPLVDGSESLHSLAKPILAMLGGFSASVVYRILRRLVDTVESLVRGETADILEVQEQAAKARLNQELVQNRLKLAANLIRLQQQLDASASPDQLKQEIERMLNNLMPFELEDEQSELQTLEPENVPQA